MSIPHYQKSIGWIAGGCLLFLALTASAYLCDGGWSRIDTHGLALTQQGAYDDAWMTAEEHMGFLGYSYGEVVSVTYEFTSTLWHCAMTTRVRSGACRGLDVFTSRGTASPAAGEHLYDIGISITGMVSSVVGSGATREVCTGWTGTGSVPSSGSGNLAGPFSLNADSSITWQWATEYWLDIDCENGGEINVADQWVREGVQVSIQASAAPGYVFDGWTGSLSSAGSLLVFDMNQAHTLTASFQALVTTNGTPHWWLIEHGLTNASMDVEADTDIDEDGMSARDEFIADTDPNASNSCLVLTGAYTLATGGGTGGIRLAFPASTARYYQLEYCVGLTNYLVGTTNLGWGVPGMAITNDSTGTWYGVIRALLQEP
jgi:uncharacterized repeat protein (TIGR02543 family)